MFAYCFFLTLLRNGKNHDFLMKMRPKNNFFFPEVPKKVLVSGVKSGSVGVQQTNNFLFSASRLFDG